MNSNTRFGFVGFCFLVVLGVSSLMAQPMGDGKHSSTESGGQAALTGSVVCAAQLSHQYNCRRNETQQSCAIDCVQSGSHYVLQVGDEEFSLNGQTKELERYAGGKATVHGSVTGDHVSVSSVAGASK